MEDDGYDARRQNATLRACTGGCGRIFYFVGPHETCAECWRKNYRATKSDTPCVECGGSGGHTLKCQTGYHARHLAMFPRGCGIIGCEGDAHQKITHKGNICKNCKEPIPWGLLCLDCVRAVVASLLSGLILGWIAGKL